MGLAFVMALMLKACAMGTYLGPESKQARMAIKATNNEIDQAMRILEEMRCEKQLMRVAVSGKNLEIRSEALNRLSNQELIYSVFNNAKDHGGKYDSDDLRTKAYDRLSDPNILGRIAADPNAWGEMNWVAARNLYVHDINNKEVLSNLALHGTTPDIKMLAIENITNTDVLYKIAKNEKEDPLVRVSAANSLKLHNPQLFKTLSYAKDVEEICLLKSFPISASYEIEKVARKILRKRLYNCYYIIINNLFDEADEHLFAQLLMSEVAMEYIDPELEIPYSRYANLTSPEILRYIIENSMMTFNDKLFLGMVDDAFIGNYAMLTDGYGLLPLWLESVSDQQVLLSLANKHPKSNMRSEALDLISDEGILSELLQMTLNETRKTKQISSKREEVFASLTFPFLRITDLNTLQQIVENMECKSAYCSYLFDLSLRSFVQSPMEKDLLENIIDDLYTRNRINDYDIYDLQEILGYATLVKDADKNMLDSMFFNETDKNKTDIIFKHINDQSLLKKILISHTNDFYRYSAADKLNDQSLLGKLILDTESWLTAKKLLDNILSDTILATITLQHPLMGIRVHSIKRITDPNILYQIINNTSDNVIRDIALGMLGDEALLASLALKHNDLFVRTVAIERINTPQKMHQFLEEHIPEKARLVATKKIHDNDLLQMIAMNDPEIKIRNSAARRLAFNADMDQQWLKMVVLEQPEWHIKNEALNMLSCPDQLAELVVDLHGIDPKDWVNMDINYFYHRALGKLDVRRIHNREILFPLYDYIQNAKIQSIIGDMIDKEDNPY